MTRAQKTEELLRLYGGQSVELKTRLTHLDDYDFNQFYAAMMKDF